MHFSWTTLADVVRIVALFYLLALAGHLAVSFLDVAFGFDRFEDWP